MKPLLEVCCGNYESVCAAVEAGAERIELCSALPVGGITPSIGLVQKVRRDFPNLKLHVLVRPREGNFVYTPDEVQTMTNDIVHFVELGVDGIVSGALTTNGAVDSDATAQLIAAAGTASFTFHRAFDYIPMREKALKELIDLGCTRVLTSGGAATALEGADVIAQCVQQARGRIIILAGAGINDHNAIEVLKRTKCTELHASCSHKKRASSDGPALGNADDGGYLLTDASVVRRILDALNNTAL